MAPSFRFYVPVCGHDILEIHVREQNVLEIIPVYNIKGGVGKTTTAVNLAFLSARAGWRTLLWDLDPQAAASYVLRSEPGRRDSAARLVRKRSPIDDLVLPTAYDNLDLLPADFSYRDMEQELGARKKRATRLLKLMRPLQLTYASVFLDCAPGMSLVSENILRAADALLVPTVPSPLSLRMLRQLQTFLKEQGWADLTILAFFSMVDRRRTLHRDSIAHIRARFPEMLRTEVPYFADIERMTVRREPLPAYAPSCAGARLYAALWEEIDARLNAARGLSQVSGVTTPM